MSRALSVVSLVLALALGGTPLCRCLQGSAQPGPEEHGCCSSGGGAQLSSARCCNGSAAALPTKATLEHPTSFAAVPVLSDVAPELNVHSSVSPCETPPRLASSRTSPILRI